MKITVVGAGNVGTTCATEMAEKEIAEEIILVDIKEGITKGKALDIWQASAIQSFDTRVEGVSNDYEATKDSDVVVITAGLPRKPGMSRDDLIHTNALIVKEVTENIVKYSPDAILIVVSNPLDVMTYAAFLASKKSSSRVFGMAGILDTARYKSFLASELNISPKSIHAILMGGHGDSMVPLPRYTTVAGIPVNELISSEKLNSIIERTKKGGTELVNLMGTSAWYAPGAAAAQMAEAIVKNSRRVFPVCAALNGEYGLKDLHLGVPVVLGKNGIEKIIELKLNGEEMKMVRESAKQVKELMKILDDMNIFPEKFGDKNPVLH
ncbi:MAG: malate dehydrogenase [Ignavibacteriae bacterium]|nr:malate dehydrogenase [Ignavibacteriota bacterium]